MNMNMKALSLALGLSFLTATAIAAPSLGNVSGNPALDPVRDTGAESVLLTDTDGFNDTATTQLLMKGSAYSMNTSFGIYGYSRDVDNNVMVGDMLTVFDGSDEAFDTGSGTTQTLHFDVMAGTVTANGNVANIGQQFGFYIRNAADEGGFTWYSHAELNADGERHALIYHPAKYGLQDNQPLIGSDVVVAFEDSCAECKGDWDYKDMVVGINDVVPVPEPATLMLMLMGLAGLGASRRLRRAA